MIRLEVTARTTSHHLIACTPPEDDPSWTLGDATDLVFMAKARSTDADGAAILDLSLSNGDIVPDSALTATLIIPDDAWPSGNLPDMIEWGLMGYDSTGRRQVASGTMKVRDPIPDSA